MMYSKGKKTTHHTHDEEGRDTAVGTLKKHRHAAAAPPAGRRRVRYADGDGTGFFMIKLSRSMRVTMEKMVDLTVISFLPVTATRTHARGEGHVGRRVSGRRPRQR